MTEENDNWDKKVLCFIPLRIGCIIIGFCTFFCQGLYFFGLLALSYCHREDPLNTIYCPFTYYYWPALTVASLFLIAGAVRISWKLLLPWLVLEPISWVIEWMSFYDITRYILPFTMMTSLITGMVIPVLWFFLSVFIGNHKLFVIEKVWIYCRLALFISVTFAHFYWCVWLLLSEYYEISQNLGLRGTGTN